MLSSSLSLSPPFSSYLAQSLFLYLSLKLNAEVAETNTHTLLSLCLRLLFCCSYLTHLNIGPYFYLCLHFSSHVPSSSLSLYYPPSSPSYLFLKLKWWKETHLFLSSSVFPCSSVALTRLILILVLIFIFVFIFPLISPLHLCPYIFPHLPPHVCP